MPHYAIPSPAGYGVQEAEGPEFVPSGSVALPNYAGIPVRPSPGHELAVQNGALVWVPGPTDAAWTKVRAARDALLAATDWRVVQASDRGELAAWNASPWKTYRQALRDITTQADPFNITWPAPPA